MQNPKQSTSGIIFKFSRNFTSQSRSRSFFHFTFTSRSRFPVIFISLSLLDLDLDLKSFFFTCTSRKEWIAFFLHFSLLDCPKPTLAEHCLMRGENYTILGTINKYFADTDAFKKYIKRISNWFFNHVLDAKKPRKCVPLEYSQRLDCLLSPW